MDKEKQIEEMAKIIRADYKEWLDVTGCIPQGTSYYAECLGGAIDCAELLYNAGYRKIPENAVVLTGEEYEKLNNAVDSVQVAVSSFTRLETLYKIKCKELELAEEKTRKETAEKFANSIENILKQPFEGKTEKQEYQHKGMEEGLRMALEICKEITEGK